MKNSKRLIRTYCIFRIVCMLALSILLLISTLKIIEPTIAGSLGVIITLTYGIVQIVYMKATKNINKSN